MSAEPSVGKRLWESWKRIAAKIAHVQGHLLLSLIYLLIVSPIAILFRLFGQDALNLKTKKKISYWMPRAPIDSTADFLKKQY